MTQQRLDGGILHRDLALASLQSCAVHFFVGARFVVQFMMTLVNGWLTDGFSAISMWKSVEVRFCRVSKAGDFRKKKQFSADLGCEMNRLNLMTEQKP